MDIAHDAITLGNRNNLKKTYLWGTKHNKCGTHLLEASEIVLQDLSKYCDHIFEVQVTSHDVFGYPHGTIRKII